jgi:glutamyl-tRNA synthetase
MLRFEVLPLEDIKIDSLMIAIINYLYAQQIGDKFIIRIKDIDKDRNIIGKDGETLMILEKFALLHSAVFYQSQNLHIYQILAIRLLQEDKAFLCICNNLKEDNKICNGDCINKKFDINSLKKDKISFVIRIKGVNSNNFIILKEDDSPTQDFASACDDILNGIDFIIDTKKYLTNILKQEYIKTQLGYKNKRKYIYLPQILNGDITVKWLLEEGFLPDAIINYLLLLLIDNQIQKEIFTMPKVMEWFQLENISKEVIKFDIEKLKFLNREHLKLMDNRKLSSLFGFDDNDIGELAKLYLQEVSTINELKIKIEAIFAPKNFDGEWGREMKIIQKIILNAPMIYTFKEFQEYIIAESGLNGKELSIPLNLLITSVKNGIALDAIYPLIKSYIMEVVL